MTTKQFRKLSVGAGLALPLILLGAVGSLAGEQPDDHPNRHPAMTEPAVMGEDMMAMHQKMHARMQAMDQKLDALVAEMEAASGYDKTDAIAAVVAELVDQRKVMHGMMAGMQPRVMGPMMEHGRSGMMVGTKQPTGDCPMMKLLPSGGEEGGEEDHSAHHPER
jgi:hypothetical protein